MRFALMIEPQQGLTYAEQLAIVRRAEAAGFESFFRSDHYAELPGAGRRADDRRLGRPRRARPRDVDGSGWGRSSRRSPSGRSATSRRSSTTVDEMSGGRVEFGLGAGWNDAEHAQLGLPFPEIRERADLLEEQLAGPARAVGRARRLVVRRAGTCTIDGSPVPSEAGRAAGSAARAEWRAAAAAPDRGRGIAAVAPDRRALRRRVQPVVVVAGQGARRSSRSSTRRAGRSGEIRARWADRSWPAS